ncbi:MAG: pilus assembly protein TadG-related protein [Pseudomonadota bacterium]
MSSSITAKNNKLQNRGRQNGQSSVFVIVFLGIVLLSLTFLYKAGKLTGEKMEMQNAADAAAYSVALLEARDLNFMAYTNRAMVANEVAIGQAVGLATMPRHWQSTGHYLDALCGARIEVFAQGLQAAPPTSPAGAVLKGICKGIRFVAKGFKKTGKFGTKAMDKVIANPIAFVAHHSNQFLSTAQTLYHFGTIAYVTKAISEVVDDNANDVGLISNSAQKAQLSPYGLTTLLAHLKTYGSFDAYNSKKKKQGKFTRTYYPNRTWDTEGYERFASIIGASRDEFSKERGWKLPIIPRVDENPKFTIPIIPKILEFKLELKFVLELSINKRGGSELRFIDKKKALGNKFNWSAADTTGSQTEFEFMVSITPRVCDPTGILGCTNLGTLSFRAGIVRNKLKFRGSLAIKLKPIIDTTIYIPNKKGLSIDFPLDTAFGAAGAQIGKTAITSANTAQYLEELPKKAPTSYWGAPLYPEYDSPAVNPHTIAWKGSPIIAPARGSGGPNFQCPFPPVNCTVPIVTKWLPSQRPSKKYDGLKRYTDTLNPKDLWGFEGPQNIIGLQKHKDVLFTSTASDPAGQFRLDTSPAKDIMGSLSKGEVYFKRSNYISYFKREDGFEERGSAFNPYWQARLAPLSHADRAVANVQQHGENLENSGMTPLPDAVWGPLEKWTP